MAHQQNLAEVNAIWDGGPGGTVGGGTDWGGIASSLKGFGSLLNLGAGIAGIITGSSLEAEGLRQNAEAAAAAARYNAALALMAGREAEADKRRYARRALSKQFVTMAGKSGVLAEEGGWLETLVQNTEEYERDSLNASIGSRNTASLELARARNLRRQGELSASAALLSGGAQVSSALGKLYA